MIFSINEAKLVGLNQFIYTLHEGVLDWIVYSLSI